jgi:riboflavin kinase/FMN adenylyltransferase
MEIFHDFDSVPAAYSDCAISIGKFDGAHCGHALIISRLKKCTNKLSAPSIVVIFCPLPIEILRTDLGVRPIQTHDRKIELIYKLGADAVVVINPSKQFLKQSAESFFFDVLCKQLHSRAVV